MHFKKTLIILNSSRILFFTVLIMLCLSSSSCNFNITDNPGPQISSTIESSKKHKVFICSYKIAGNKLNGQDVASIFAEKSYSLTEGLFGHFDIDCCKSQLIIFFKNVSGIDTSNKVNWKVVGFESYHSYAIVKYYQGTIFPDSINLQIIPSVKDTLNTDNTTLYKQ